MDTQFKDLTDLTDGIAASSGSQFDKFRECEPYFRQVVDRKLYLSRLHSVLQDNLAGKNEVTPDMSAGNFLVLAGSKYTSWAILKHAVKTRQLYLTPSHSMSAKIGGTPLQVDRYFSPTAIELSVLDPTKELELCDSGAMQTNQIVSKDGRTHLLDIFPTQAGYAYTVRLNTVPHERFEWSFSRQSLKPVKVSSLRAADSNLTTIFDLLAAVGSPQSVDPLTPYAKHELHFIRWQAIKTIGSIDPRYGLELTERAATDEHPHVRAAAKATLDSLESA